MTDAPVVPRPKFTDTSKWRWFMAAMLGLAFIVMVGMLHNISGMRHDISDFGDRIDQGGRALSSLNKAQEDITVNQAAGRERSYAQRSVNCTNTILDNDRDFELTATCTDPHIAAYYPPTVCQRYFPSMAECGTKSNNPGV